MFLGWYDPDRKKPARAKLADAIERYEEKFGRTPLFCLTSPQDAAELAEPSRKFPGDPPVRSRRGATSRAGRSTSARTLASRRRRWRRRPPPELTARQPRGVAARSARVAAPAARGPR